MERVAQNAKDDLVLITVDVDKDHREVAEHYEVAKLPTFALFRNKQIVAKVSGPDMEALLTRIKEQLPHLQDNNLTADDPVGHFETALKKDALESDQDEPAANFNEQLEEAGDKVVLAAFVSQWNPACRVMSPIVQQIA